MGKNDSEKREGHEQERTAEASESPASLPFLYDSMDAAVAAIFDEVSRQVERGRLDWETALLIPRRVLGVSRPQVQLIGFSSFSDFESNDEWIRSQYLWAVNRFAKVVGAVRAFRIGDERDCVEIYMECADGTDGAVYVARRGSDRHLGPFVRDRTSPEGWFVPANDTDDSIYGRAGVDEPLLSHEASQRYAWLVGRDEEEDEHGEEDDEGDN